MYDAYYNTWLAHFPNSQLLFTDTDSFCVAVEHPDVYGEMATFQNWFDFSEYPRDHPLFDETNRKVITFIITITLQLSSLSRFKKISILLI